MKVCGANGCAAVASPLTFWNDGSGGLTYDAPVGPYYRLEIAVGDRGRIAGRETIYWLRSARMTHSAGQSSFDPWVRMSEAQSRRLERAAGGLKPLRPTLRRVTIDGEAAADPSSYIRLFGRFAPSYAYAAEDAKTITLVITPEHPNPWLQRQVTLRYRPELRQLERPDYEDVRLPDGLANRLDRSSSDSSAALIGGIGAAGLLALAALALVGRRRMNPNGRRGR